MSNDSSETAILKCTGCGFESSAGSDRWDSANHPSFGSMTQCPECGSTNIHTQG